MSVEDVPILKTTVSSGEKYRGWAPDGQRKDTRGEVVEIRTSRGGLKAQGRCGRDKGDGHPAIPLVVRQATNTPREVEAPRKAVVCLRRTATTVLPFGISDRQSIRGQKPAES